MLQSDLLSHYSLITLLMRVFTITSHNFAIKRRCVCSLSS